MPWLDLAVAIFPGLRLVIYNTYVAKWQIDNLDNERQCLIALSWQPDRAALYRDIKLSVIAFFYDINTQLYLILLMSAIIFFFFYGETH